MGGPYLAVDHDALTSLVIAVFRLNGALLSAGDRLVRDLGLTSARWQVLGVVASSPAPLSMASIARNMGMTRQAIRQAVNDLANSGHVSFAPNPHHRRAHLVVLTPEGGEANRAALARQRPWAARLADGLTPTKVEITASLLSSLLARLDEMAVDAGEFEDDECV